MEKIELIELYKNVSPEVKYIIAIILKESESRTGPQE